MKKGWRQKNYFLVSSEGKVIDIDTIKQLYTSEKHTQRRLSAMFEISCDILKKYLRDD